MKDSVILYKSDWDLVKLLNDVQKATWIDAVFAYMDGVMPSGLDQGTMLAFMAAKNHIDRDVEKWNATRHARSEAGKKHTGNQYTRRCLEQNGTNGTQFQSLEQMEQNGTNGTDNVNVNVNVLSKESEICAQARTHARTEGSSVVADVKMIEAMNQNSPWLEQYAINNHINIQQARRALAEFTKWLQDCDDNLKTEKDYRNHFAKWMLKRTPEQAAKPASVNIGALNIFDK